MNQLTTTPALHPSTTPTETPTSPLRTIQNFTHSTQQTMWTFLYPSPINTTVTANPASTHPPTPQESQQSSDLGATPPSTPLQNVEPTTQNSSLLPDTILPRMHQQPLQPERSNKLWGNAWVMEKPTSLFRVLSNNTSTINLSNLDMQAITTALNHLHASIFAAQETNVNWDVDSRYQLVTQCRRTSPQIKIATSTSAEKLSNWFKPGGTLLLALNQWTSRVTKYGNDPHLGRWSYMEFIGKNDKRLIVISAYRVCNQQFNAASQTMTAQQIRLLQACSIALNHEKSSWTISYNKLSNGGTPTMKSFCVWT